MNAVQAQLRQYLKAQDHEPEDLLTFKRLLDQNKASLDACTIPSETPGHCQTLLMCAIEAKLPDFVRLVLQAGASLKVMDQQGTMPFELAIKQVLGALQGLDDPKTWDKMPPALLVFACLYEQLRTSLWQDLSRHFALAPASESLQTSLPSRLATALSELVRDPEALIFLQNQLMPKLLRDTWDDLGFMAYLTTPKPISPQAFKESFIKLGRQRGLFNSLDTLDNRGYQALTHTRFPEAYQFLLQAPECPINLSATHPDSLGNTLLHWAVLEGEIELVKILSLDPNLKFNKTNAQGLTALAYLARQPQASPADIFAILYRNTKLALADPCTERQDSLYERFLFGHQALPKHNARASYLSRLQRKACTRLMHVEVTAELQILHRLHRAAPSAIAPAVDTYLRALVPHWATEQTPQILALYLSMCQSLMHAELVYASYNQALSTFYYLQQSIKADDRVFDLVAQFGFLSNSLNKRMQKRMEQEIYIPARQAALKLYHQYRARLPSGLLIELGAKSRAKPHTPSS